MIVKFKKVIEKDLDSIFPVITFSEYSLLMGEELRISNSEYESLVKNKYLNVGDVSISDQLINVTTNDNGSILQQEIQKIVDDKFIYSNNVVDVLMTGIEMQKNIILYGRGGHGKSEITTLVLDSLYDKGILKEKAFVQAFGDGLTEEKLFGGLNIKKYKEQGLIEHLPEFSFMNHEVVVFEEIFDAPANILLSLKDIMTSGQFRQGNETFKVKTKVIIGLTNKSKTDFAVDDDSLKALAERFPLTLKVEWADYNSGSFRKLFKKVLGDTFCNDNFSKLSTLSDIIATNNLEGATFVSPRTAVAAAQLFCAGKPLEYISEIDPKVINDYNTKVVDAKLTQEQQEFIDKINKFIDAEELEIVSESEEFLQALNALDIDKTASMSDAGVDLNTNLEAKKELKYKRTVYLQNIVDRYNFSKGNYNKSVALTKRLNDIKKNLKIKAD